MPEFPPSPHPPSDPAERELATADGRLTLKSLATEEEYEACLELQLVTWGSDFRDRVTPALLQIGRKVGGVTAGAWTDDRRLAGFVFGLTGVSGGRLVHWSHMLAVREPWRGGGLGVALKLYQREILLALPGDRRLEAVYWTFDPLVARNAHLNLNRLGAGVAEYVRDYYGTGEDSLLSAGIGTDRFVVAWPLGTDRVRRAAAGARLEEELPAGAAEAPVANPGGACGRELPRGPLVRVEVPRDIQAVRRADPPTAVGWRASTRWAFEGLLGRGFRVRGLVRGVDDRMFYVLEAEEAR